MIRKFPFPLIFLLIQLLAIKCELVDWNQKCKQKNQPIIYTVAQSQYLYARFTVEQELAAFIN